jgi:hypothetical protein
MTDKTPIRIKSAGYGGYSANFSDYYFGAPMVAHSVQNIKKHFGNTIPPLKWGAYQKWAPDDPNDPNNWNRDNSGGPVLFDNWDSAVEEAREDMAKLPPFKGDDGPDPDQPGMKKHTMLEHLDRVVTVALLEKYQIGNNPPYSGIPVEVVVDYQAKHWRRHKIRTVWERENNHDPKYNCKKLTIHMTCPNGGWIGTALWKNYDGSQGPFTRYMATYAVPPKPANNAGQIVFIFNGLESIPDGNNVPAILQPVLQWTNENGGTWAIRSWYVPASYTPSFNQMPALNDVKPFTTVDQPAWTAATPVNPGDVLLGIITGDGANYTSQFQKGGAVVGATTLNVTNIATLTYPVAVIEA